MNLEPSERTEKGKKHIRARVENSKKMDCDESWVVFISTHGEEFKALEDYHNHPVVGGKG